ncbi:hypothetical protein D917_08225 [Trichinella nativa]|uniref:Uncharacterized protein n=1 Tax=Trichinella nativa TaxID=6335 RepID=A0A1Y3EL20_9BILA|nr:hypothetical protein D917_08225 [Trichinella nativa]
MTVLVLVKYKNHAILRLPRELCKNCIAKEFNFPFNLIPDMIVFFLFLMIEIGCINQFRDVLLNETEKLCVQIECLNRSNELLRKSLREKWTKCALHSYAEEKWLFLVLYLN